jgi:hypothetical protein
MVYKVKSTKKRKPTGVERFFLERFKPTGSVPEMFRNLYGIRELERTRGTMVRYGKGEEETGVITGVTEKGVWVQPIKEDIEFGFKPVGKRIFIHKERFEKHLGEKSAVSPEIMLFTG